MPKSLYAYIFQNSRWQQAIVIVLTLALLPLAPIPLELQRRILDDAVAKGDTDLLIRLSIYYLIALLIAAGLKMAMRMQRELISAKIVHALRTSVYYCIYTVMPPSKLKIDPDNDDRVNEGAVVSMLSSEVEKLGGGVPVPPFPALCCKSVRWYLFWGICSG